MANENTCQIGFEKLDQKAKVETITKVLEIIKNVNVPKAFGICGSSAFGFSKLSSDIDMWVCINKQDVLDFFRNREIRRLLELDKKIKTYETPISELRNGKIDVLNVKTVISGQKCGFDIYTRRSFSDICNLRNFKINRWREYGILRKEINFKNCLGESITGECEIRGDYSAIKNVIIIDGLFHYGQHIDRIAASKLLIDEISLSTDILFLWIKILLSAEKYAPNSFIDFWYRCDRVPAEIKDALNLKFIKLIKNVKKWQKSLKSTDLIT